MFGFLFFLHLSPQILLLLHQKNVSRTRPHAFRFHRSFIHIIIIIVLTYPTSGTVTSPILVFGHAFGVCFLQYRALCSFVRCEYHVRSFTPSSSLSSVAAAEAAHKVTAMTGLAEYSDFTMIK